MRLEFWLSLSYLFFLTAGSPQISAAPPTPPLDSSAMLSHDTPIIVQGGSLTVWSQNDFTYSARSLIVHLNGTIKYLIVDDNPALPHTRDNTIPAVTLPAANAWTLCTGAPQYLKYAPTGSSLTIDSWDEKLPQKVFDDNPETPGQNPYLHGRSHVEQSGFGGLYFGTNGQTCPAVVTATAPCTANPSANCRIVAPSLSKLDKKVYIVLSTK